MPGPGLKLAPPPGGGGTSPAPVADPLAAMPPGPGGGGPTGAPMATPEPMAGLKANAKMQVTMAMDVLGQALPNLDVKTAEGQAVLKALQILTKAFGESSSGSRDLIPSEVMTLLSGLPAQNPSPGAKAAAAQPSPGASGAPIPQA